MLRARDFHKKEDAIKALKTKAAYRNPDEFYFGMQRNRTKDGVHVGRADESNKYTAEELALMKTQDVKYVALKASEEAKKAAKLKANLHRVGLDADEEPVSEEDEERYDEEGFAIRAAPRQKRKHTVFVDDAEAARAFDAEGLRKTKQKSAAGDDAAALRCEIIVPEGSHGGGCDPQPNTHVITLLFLSQNSVFPAPRPFKPEELTTSLSPSQTRSVVVEAPDSVTLRQRTVKTTSFGTAGMHCAAVSRLKRTARLSDILRHMGHGNSGQDPDWVPPSDAEILAAYYRRMMAKQRWTKAQAALTSIRAMQGGLLGALGGGAAQKAKAFPAFGAIPGAEPKPPPPPPPRPPRPLTPEDPDSPRSQSPAPVVVIKPRRTSITELTSGEQAKAKASAAMGRMLRETDGCSGNVAGVTPPKPPFAN